MNASLRRIILAIPLVLIAVLPAQAAKQKADRFDGRWTVVIITDAGTCDRAYRYGVRIDGGRVTYAGDSNVAVSGSVDVGGRVSVSVRSGESSAQGSGRLSESDGEGTWRGTSQNASCSGRWQAERAGESTGAGH